MVRVLGFCDRKVVGGKMFRIRVDLELEGERSKMIELRILGDFFLHPEEALEGLESVIRDAYNQDRGMFDAISGFLEEKDTVVYGGSPEDIAGAVSDAVTDAFSRR